MNIYFIIIITLILITIHLINFSILEPFCTKKNNDKCLNKFTYSYAINGGQAIGIYNNSVNVNTNINNSKEKLFNFKCVPNNYPNETGGTDCNTWASFNDANRSRGNDARDWFKRQEYYLDCKQIGKSKQGCASGYNTMGYKSYKDLGYSCDIGNGIVPTKIDSTTGVITCATDSNGDCLVRKSKSDCVSSLNLIPADNSGKNTNQGLVCSEGKVGTKCINLYNNLELKTLRELGYECSNSIGEGKLPGKVINDETYNFASYNNKKIINNCPTALNFQPLNQLADVVCSEYKTSTDDSYPTACEQAYTRFNLYPSTNPLVIKGNNPKYSITNTFKNSSDLFSTYSKFQQAFPPNTNSNSAQSISDGIETILSETPIKLSCCKRPSITNNSPTTINVRVPVNPTIKSINPNTEKFNFQYSRIEIPENSCPVNLYSGSPDCDNFYGLYCDNIINYMREQNINVDTELLNYAPECACYAPQTKEQAGYPPSTPSVCYKNGCDMTSNPNVYLDPNSRDGNSQKTCSLTICNSINDFSGLTAGGAVNISPQTKNQCGDNSSNTSNPIGPPGQIGPTNSTSPTSPSGPISPTDQTSTTGQSSPSGTSSTTDPNTTNTNEPSTTNTSINEPSTNEPSTTNTSTNEQSTTNTSTNEPSTNIQNTIKNNYGTIGIITLIVIFIMCLLSSVYFVIKKKK